MAEIPIDVQAHATSRVAPERATVHAAISEDGPQQDPVIARVTAAVAAQRQSLEGLRDKGAITALAIDQVRIGAHRPWNDKGEQLPLVYTATIGIRAQFADFQALSGWVLGKDLSVHGIEWDLTEQTRAELERRTRQDALRRAAVHAQDYADALDLGPVQIRAIRDPGASPAPAMLMARAAMADTGAELDLEPEPVEVSAEVHATFVAGA